MTRGPVLLAGPFRTDGEAWMAACTVRDGDFFIFRSNGATRKHHRGWYAYLRSPGTVHPGSKRWRSWVKSLPEQLP